MNLFATDEAVKKLLEFDFIASGTETEPFDIDLIEATTRTFVSDLPWWERFLIWLFPRMYDIREYNP